jgi:two-component system, response regulator YesN
LHGKWIFKSILRKAAERSRVPVILLQRLSEKFTYKIEETNQLSVLQNLAKEMVIEYCDLVMSSSLSKYSKVIQKVIEYLVTHYNQPLNINELANSCLTHPSHLSRKFNQETGLSITAYLQKVRINKAKYLLGNETMSIEEIAWLVGYEDSSYFSRVFKKETGLTPSRFMKT